MKDLICGTINNGEGCDRLAVCGCEVYSRSGMKFRTRQGYCPVVDDGPNKTVNSTPVAKKRSGQQKQKK